MSRNLRTSEVNFSTSRMENSYSSSQVETPTWRMNFVSCARSMTSGVGVQAIGWFSRTLVSCILINNFTAETRETQRKQISFGSDFATLRVRRNNRVSRKARKGRKEEMDQNVVDISLPNG